MIKKAYAKFLSNIGDAQEFNAEEEYQLIKYDIIMKDDEIEIEKSRRAYFDGFLCNQRNSSGSRIFRKDPARKNIWVNVQTSTDYEALERIEKNLIERKMEYNPSIRDVRKRKNFVHKKQLKFIKETNNRVECLSQDNLVTEA